MKFLALLPLLCFAFNSDSPSDLNQPVLTSEEIAEINSKQSQWVAAENWLTRMPLKDFIDSYKDSFEKPNSSRGKFRKPDTTKKSKVSIAPSFNTQTQWPNCIVPIYNQGGCSAGYAIAIAATLSERLCISNQTLFVGMNLSSQYIVSCSTNGQSCQGGFITYAWESVVATGTGVQTCQPYVGSATCSNVCANGTPVTMYYPNPNSITEFDNAADIQLEVFTNGPITASMALYKDFASYQSGIYTPTTASPIGAQVVKIIGWGVQGTTNYWICANSYGTSWGQSGYFWIQFGVCGIESLGYSGDLSLNFS